MDEYEGHREVFECEEPPTGVSYRVLEDEWRFDDLIPPLRIIKQIELLSVGR